MRILLINTRKVGRVALASTALSVCLLAPAAFAGPAAPRLEAAPQATEPSPEPTAPALEATETTTGAAETTTETAQAPSEPIASHETRVTTRQSRTRALRTSSEAVEVVSTQAAQGQSDDLGEVLQRRSAVVIRRSGGLGSGSQASLAGLGGDQLRFFVDGVPIAWSAYALGVGNIPVNLVERVEVYSGVVPIRFAADALGGAVNVVTEPDRPENSFALSTQVGSFGLVRSSINATQVVPALGLQLRVAGFLDRAENDYPITVDAANASGQTRPTRLIRNHDAYQGAGLTASASLVEPPLGPLGRRGRWLKRLTARAYLGQYDKEIPHNVIMTVPYGEPTYQKRTQGLSLRVVSVPAPSIKVDTALGLHQHSSALLDVSPCVYDWRGVCLAETPVAGEIGIRPRDQLITFTTAWARSHGRLQLSRWQAVEASASLTADTRRGEDRYLTSTGSADPLKVPVGVTNLVVGGAHELKLLNDRLENVSFVKGFVQAAGVGPHPDAGFATTTHRLLTAAGLGHTGRFALTRHSSVKASYEWTRRMPSADELFGNGVLVLENTELRPEASHNLNVGVELSAPTSALGNLQASATGMMRSVDDFILLIANDQTYRYENIGHVRALALRGAVDWTSPRQWFSARAQIGWVDLRNLSTDGAFARFRGDRLPNRPFLTSTHTVGARYPGLLLVGDALSVQWTTRYVQAFFRAWESVGSVDTKQVIPTQLLHHIDVAYRLAFDARRVSVSMAVHNLTDADAFDVVGVQRPGRSFFTKLTLEL